MQATLIQKILATSSVSSYVALGAIAQKIIHTKAIKVYARKRQKLIEVYSSGFWAKQTYPKSNSRKDIFYKKIQSDLSLPVLKNTFLYLPLFWGSKKIGIMIMHMPRHKRYLLQNEIEILKMYGFISGLIMQRLELKKELHLAKKIQKSMVNTTVHNLRTPLTSLAVYIRLFKKKEKNRQKLLWLQGIATASQRLAHVADDLTRKKNFIKTCSNQTS